MSHFLDLPPSTNDFYDDRLRYKLSHGTIFVFGSNESGIHGAGAAKDALCEYGAILGIGEGLQNESYAIPTKDRRILTLPLSKIQQYVEQFKLFNQTHPELKFFVTAIGTGLAGYQHKDIAPMFKGVQNCWLPESWRAFLCP